MPKQRGETLAARKILVSFNMCSWCLQKCSCMQLNFRVTNWTEMMKHAILYFSFFFYTAESIWRFIYICIYLFIHYYMRQSFGSLNTYAFIYLFITMMCVNMDHHLLFKDVLYSNCFAVKSLWKWPANGRSGTFLAFEINIVLSCKLLYVNRV